MNQKRTVYVLKKDLLLNRVARINFEYRNKAGTDSKKRISSDYILDGDNLDYEKSARKLLEAVKEHYPSARISKDCEELIDFTQEIYCITL